jgi:hypothetical protein
LIAIFPNPVKEGIIGLEFTNMPVGKYNVQMIDNIGQIMLRDEINHTAGSSFESIRFNPNIAKGIYHLEVTGPGEYKNDIKLQY